MCRFRSHRLRGIYAQLISKKTGKDLVNKDGNIPKRGVVPKFSDLEVLSLSMASESLGIDSESYLFNTIRLSRQLLLVAGLFFIYGMRVAFLCPN